MSWSFSVRPQVSLRPLWPGWRMDARCHRQTVCASCGGERFSVWPQHRSVTGEVWCEIKCLIYKICLPFPMKASKTYFLLNIVNCAADSLCLLYILFVSKNEQNIFKCSIWYKMFTKLFYTQLEDTGRYSCLANSPAGDDDKEFLVRVNGGFFNYLILNVQQKG